MKKINIQEFKDQLNIEQVADVLGVRVTTRGTPLQCDCPVHQSESKKSFHIYLATNSWYCTGCTQGGDCISLWQFVRGGTFIEAVKELASEFNITLDLNDAPVYAEDHQFREHNKTVNFLYEQVFRWGKDLLNNPTPDPKDTFYHQVLAAKNYLINERKYTPEILLKTDWCILPHSDVIRQELLNTYPELKSQIETLNLNGANTNEMLVSIPFRNDSGAIDGFIKRTHLKKTEYSKYSSFFGISGEHGGKKSCALGIHRIKNNVDTLLVLEGYPDSELMHAMGIPCVCFGTGGWSKHFYKSLKRKNPKKIILCLDNDQVGPKNTLSSIKSLLSDFDVCVIPAISLGKYKDPDEYIKGEGIEAWQKIMLSAIPWYDYVYPTLKLTLMGKNLSDEIYEYHKLIASEYVRNCSKQKIMEVLDIKFKAFDKMIQEYSKDIDVEEVINQILPPIEDQDVIYPIGYNENVYFFMTFAASEPQLFKMSSSTISTFSGLVTLNPDPAFWERHYGMSITDATCAKAIAQDLIRWASSKQKILEDSIRSAGLWKDGRKCILNTGDQIFEIKQGVPVLTEDRTFGRYTYLTTKGFKIPELDRSHIKFFTQLREMLEKSSLQKMDRRILLGLIGSLYLIGIFKRVPSVELNGESDIGKSQMQDLINEFTYLLNTKVHATATLASVRRILSPIALHLSETNKLSQSEDQKQMGFVDMKKSTWDGTSTTLVIDGEPTSFESKKQIWETCVASRSVNEEITNRTISLMFKKRTDVTTNEINALYDAVREHSKEIGDYLFAHSLLICELVEDAVVLFKKHFNAKSTLRDTRAADKYAYIMLGYYFITNDVLPNEKQLEEMTDFAIQHASLQPNALVPKTTDIQAQDIFNAFMSKVIKDMHGSDTTIFRTIEKIQSIEISGDPSKLMDVYLDTLKLHRMFYEDGLLYIAPKQEELLAIAKKNGHNSYSSILSNLEFYKRTISKRIKGIPGKLDYIVLDFRAYNREE